MNPDDLDDFKEESIQIVEILRELDLYTYFSRNAIGATFYKVAAMNAIKTGIDLESFLRVGQVFYSTLENMVRDDDNLIFKDGDSHDFESEKD